MTTFKESQITKIYPWFFLCIILVLSIGLRLPGLGRSLWYDEVMYSTSTFMANSKDLSNFIFKGISGPFYRIFMFFWVKVFGDLEISVRLPSLVCGILSVFLVYLLSFREKG
ncbi:MAG: hypothetical protein NT033_09440, partial [Candidatus Omnitrophica bacterium]|nr:hypothetical protein [Candidatus Omnitrophota bacterium]